MLALHAALVLAHGTQGHGADGSAAEAGPAGAAHDGENAPRLDLGLRPAAHGALEAHLEVHNFRLLGPGAGGTPTTGEGHVQLTIDAGNSVAVFTPTYALPALSRGTHEIAVALVLDDGTPVYVDGRPVRSRVVLRVGNPGGQVANTETKAFDLAISNGKVATETLRVTQGETVRISWSSDAVADLHLHGYDIEARVAPDSPVAMQFRADIGGRFPIALHETGGGDAGSGGHGHRALLHLEVYPD